MKKLFVLLFALSSAAYSQVNSGPVSGGAGAGSYVPVTTAAQQTITATGAGNDITLTAADDIFFAATDDLVVTGDLMDLFGSVYIFNDSAADFEFITHQVHLDADEFEVDLFADNSAFDVAMSGSGSFAQITNGSSTLTVNAGYSSFMGIRFYPPSASIPIACDGGDPYFIYIDTTGPDLCFCNGTTAAPLDTIGACA